MRARLSAVILVGIAVIACGWGVARQTQSQGSRPASSSEWAQGSASATGSAQSAGSQSAAASGVGGAATPIPTHALIYTPTDVVRDASAGSPDMRAHREFLARMSQTGKVVYAGPWRDRDGGLVVLKVATDAEARRFADADPAVKDSLYTVDVRPWKVNFVVAGAAAKSSVVP